MIGMLPTLRPTDLPVDTLSANPRYALLNEQIFAARGEDLYIDIEGDELDDGGVQRGGLELGGRAAFHVGDLRAFVRDDEAADLEILDVGLES